MDMQLELTYRAQEIEKLIQRYLPEEKGYQKTILEAMNYSMLAGGKRLRPMLMIETYKLFAGSSKNRYRTLCSSDRDDTHVFIST